MRLFAASSPHVRQGDDIRVTMGDTIFPLLFLLGMAVYYHGVRALTLSAVSVISCVVFEYLYRRIMGMHRSIGDLSAAVTGLITALCLPASAPIWFPIVGGLFSIIIVKQLFGGLGRNIFNPAAAAVCLLSVTWPGVMSAFPLSKSYFDAFATPKSFETGVTALASLKSGALPADRLYELLLGYTPGALGTACILVIAAAAVVLLYRRIINIYVPASFLATVALAALIFPRCPSGRLDSMLYELMSGSLLFVAVFMATDPVTSPVTRVGRLLYGVTLGVLTVLMRYYGNYPEGAFFALLIANPFVLAFDRIGWRLRVKGGKLLYEQE